MVEDSSFLWHVGDRVKMNLMTWVLHSSHWRCCVVFFFFTDPSCPKQKPQTAKNYACPSWNYGRWLVVETVKDFFFTSSSRDEMTDVRTHCPFQNEVASQDNRKKNYDWRYNGIILDADKVLEHLMNAAKQLERSFEMKRILKKMSHRTDSKNKWEG